MKWVHENIGLFGGNKSAVTLGGQSAGAGSVSYHLLGKWGKSEGTFFIENIDFNYAILSN